MSDEYFDETGIGRQLGDTMMTVALLLGQEATLELIMQLPDGFARMSEEEKLEGWQTILSEVNKRVTDVDELAGLVNWDRSEGEAGDLTI